MSQIDDKKETGASLLCSDAWNFCAYEKFTNFLPVYLNNYVQVFLPLMVKHK